MHPTPGQAPRARRDPRGRRPSGPARRAPSRTYTATSTGNHDGADGYIDVDNRTGGGDRPAPSAHGIEAVTQTSSFQRTTRTYEVRPRQHLHEWAVALSGAFAAASFCFVASVFLASA